MSEPLLAVKRLDAWYGSENLILRDLDLTLQEHEIVSLIGLNGAGKTTLMNVLSGLHASFRAKSLSFRGNPVSFRQPDFKCSRYTVFDDDGSFSFFSFREYLAYVLRAYERGGTETEDLIQGFHFRQQADKLLGSLSAGNRRKAFLITAFALRLPLLLLDEPVNGLDLESTEYLYECIGSYRQFGTILFSSHVLESVTLTADRALILEKGSICRVLQKEELSECAIREVLREDGHV